MTRKRAFKKVLKELSKLNLLVGIYDAKNGKEDFMYGIETVMELIASEVGVKTYEEFSNKFLDNLIASENRAAEAALRQRESGYSRTS